MAALYDVPAPAKINLFLHVTGRRPDGYHTLETVFRFIDLCDTLHFDRRDDGRIARAGPALPGLDEDHDLTIRAARALQAATGTRYGAEIAYDKRIPSGGGLGGGSSDAASTLIALNRLWKTGLNRSELMDIARGLGADVPVFVFGQSAFAKGIGDILQPVALPPDRAYLVVRPPQSVPTATVFQDPNLTRNTQPVKIHVFTDSQTRFSPEGTLFGRNDLEAVVLDRYPNVAASFHWFASFGLNARITGSGSCFFVEFETLEKALANKEQIAGKMAVSRDATVAEGMWVCSGLSQHPLYDWLPD